MYQATNGHTIPTQREYEWQRRENRNRAKPDPSKTAVRRAIERRQEQRDLDALVNYLN